jgi:hypothetical protein
MIREPWCSTLVVPTPTPAHDVGIFSPDRDIAMLISCCLLPTLCHALPTHTTLDPYGPTYATTTAINAPMGASVTTRAAAGTADFGTRFEIGAGVTVQLAAGARFEFNNPSNTHDANPTAYLAGTAGFNNPAGNAPGAASAAPFDYNCPLNWRVNGAVPVDGPQGDDTVEVTADGYVVSTFGRTATAMSFTNGGSLTMNQVGLNGGTMCTQFPMGLIVPSTATSAGSVVTFGGATGCASFAFGMAGAVAPACGNLVATSIPDATNTVTIFLCADGTTNCSLSGTTTVQTPSGTVTSSVVTPIANADGSATYDVPGVGAVAVSPGGTPAIVASPSATTTPSADTSSSDGGGGAGGGMMLYIIIAAVVVVLAVVAVVVVKKKGGGGGGAPQDKHAAMGFENPLCMSTFTFTARTHPHTLALQNPFTPLVP